MSDYTYAELTVYAFNGRKRKSLLEAAIESAGFRREYGSDGEGLSGNGPWAFTGEEVRLGTGRDLALELIAIDPSIAFAVSTSPRYEWLGTVDYYVPTLGHYCGECGDNGAPVFTAAEIKGFAKLSEPELGLALGTAWEEWFAQTTRKKGLA